ncbi:MAG: substrate-binding domain-containing protein [Rhodobacteraceae bacterium]|jgi:LacI family transcriptional regulator|uniref:LacI family DNA-binding transcriptional regulator n=1 Tax=Albidovulum sp. TaxID=1872424 RepID=UPI001D6177B8|nr:LacI family DNA-binding transcriptional regulator [uncultured Defluviimonas sp.]MCB2126058.1 substrate-binding domain-containing protein [Paracoccaceae bacterium]MCC0071580.1 substrate-binding domain-containing protein [Paracoccaceae bacterium]
MARVTIADLAREAGVSLATVDRVLNGRLKVREETALKVHEAAQRIGYHGANAIRSRILADLPELHVGVILQKERHAFYRDFARQIESRVARVTSYRMRATIRFAETTLPGELADLLRSMSGKVQAVAASGLDHHEVTAAVADLKARGIPTFSLLSDFAQGVRESYIGVNNLKVGRSVGWLMSKIALRPGKIGIFIGGHRFHGHELRETGVRSSLREYAPDFELLNPMINLEARQITYEATLEMLAKHRDLVGLYCAGGGMEGAITALRESGRASDVVLVVNELTDETRLALQDRTVSIVISTPLPAVCEELATLILHTVANGMAETPGQRFLPFQIWTPESL